MGSPKKSAHRKALEKIAANPDVIGINKREILQYAIEPQLCNNKGNPYIEPDLVFFLRHKKRDSSDSILSIKALVIEYKANGARRLEEKGNGQLQKAVAWYQDFLKIPAEGRLITGTAYPQIKFKK